MMKIITIYFLIVVTCGFTLNKDQQLIDYYVNLIERRTDEAVQYEFPKDARMHEAVEKDLQDYGEFDFIIIGAGSTGCVIANRLSEITNWKILLLEAGPFADSDLLRIPALTSLDTYTKFNWGFETVPQKYALQGNINKKMTVSRGKGIGGTSLIYGLNYNRCNRLDYERWSDLLNDPEWNYKNVLPYFEKLEDFTNTNHYSWIDYKYRGYDGPLSVTHCVPPYNASLRVLAGPVELGYNITDYNGREQMGASIFQINTKDGKCFDAGQAYISPVKKRKNLHISDKSYVTKIDIAYGSKTVKGVIFTKNNKTYIARNRKEVILSAGAISSPQILMLSGVGPREDLELLNIPVIENLPVGKTLRDHVYTLLVFSSNITSESESTEKSVAEFLKGRGALTRNNEFDAVFYLKTLMTTQTDYPDMEAAFNNVSNSVLTQKSQGWTDETYSALNVSVPQPFAIKLYYLHTVSNGTVKLKSSNPFDYPLIDPNLFGDGEDRDIEALYQAILVTLKNLDTRAFRSMNVSLAIDQIPGCNSTEPLSREFWYCYLRTVTAIGSHQVASCSMSTSPKTGVVDKRSNVFGVKNLRVAVSSIIPFPLTGHIHGACVMVGEKVSDFIKRAYK